MEHGSYRKQATSIVMVQKESPGGRSLRVWQVRKDLLEGKSLCGRKDLLRNKHRAAGNGQVQKKDDKRAPF